MAQAAPRPLTPPPPTPVPVGAAVVPILQVTTEARGPGGEGVRGRAPGPIMLPVEVRDGVLVLVLPGVLLPPTPPPSDRPSDRPSVRSSLHLRSLAGDAQGQGSSGSRWYRVPPAASGGAGGQAEPGVPPGPGGGGGKQRLDLEPTRPELGLRPGGGGSQGTVGAEAG